MCKVAGPAHPDAAFPSPTSATPLLAHRSPDESVTVRWQASGPSGLLTHTGLAIIDLSERGLRPMADEQGRLLVAFNGEIYNHHTRRRLCQGAGARS